MHVVVASHHRLPVEGYGGPQRVVVALVRGLAALGHRVTLLAQPGTKVAEAAKIVEVAPRLFKDSGVDLKRFFPDGADILHAHFPLKQGPKGVPFVQTLHGNWKPDTPLPPNTIFLSRDHAKRHGSAIYVHNGLDPAEYIFRGRKAVLLARARCLWMPAQWDEPFGLPTIEALFSGTPVLGTRRGALPEIVTPAVGVLRDTLDELILAGDKVTTLDPRACRERAERQFTHLVMAENYVRIYQNVLTSGELK
ncbi:MAG: hypothetical protein DMD59_08790 [Gemmatimonadetes bacterium]|nr:MAG: hypothetical protein DMD59_08790 [Gemmatimonadota bacterium]